MKAALDKRLPQRLLAPSEFDALAGVVDDMLDGLSDGQAVGAVHAFSSPYPQFGGTVPGATRSGLVDVTPCRSLTNQLSRRRVTR